MATLYTYPMPTPVASGGGLKAETRPIVVAVVEWSWMEKEDKRRAGFSSVA